MKVKNHKDIHEKSKMRKKLPAEKPERRKIGSGEFEQWKKRPWESDKWNSKKYTRQAQLCPCEYQIYFTMDCPGRTKPIRVTKTPA